MEKITGFVILPVSLAVGGPTWRLPSRPDLPSAPWGGLCCHPLPWPLAMAVPGLHRCKWPQVETSGLLWVRNPTGTGSPTTKTSQRHPMEVCECRRGLAAPRQAARCSLPLLGGSNSHFTAFITWGFLLRVYQRN